MIRENRDSLKKLSIESKANLETKELRSLIELVPKEASGKFSGAGGGDIGIAVSFNKKIKAKIETIYSTSNASLPEIVRGFMVEGQDSTALAYLSRYELKFFLHNWLKRDYQARLNERKKKNYSLEVHIHDYFFFFLTLFFFFRGFISS